MRHPISTSFHGSTGEQVLYVTKFPPSPSGVALYASVFEDVLAAIGPVRRLHAPPLPAEAQSLRLSLNGYWLGRRTALRDVQSIHVELSGRALFEFFFTLGVLRRRSRPEVNVTCHDAPSLVGAPLLFRCLDRRGLRRIGMFVSRHLGSRLERRVMRSVEGVFALTAAGRDELEARFARPVHQIPHVIDAPARHRKWKSIFIPGPLSDPGPVIEIITRVLSDYTGPEPWQITVGCCTREVEHAVRTSQAGEDLQITFTGYLDEAGLLDTFARSAIVARPVGATDNSLAASGPLSWGIARGCLCITNDTRAGSTELAAAGLVIQARDIGLAVAKAMSTWPRHSLAIDIAGEAQARSGVPAVFARYSAAVSRVNASPRPARTRMESL